MYGVGHHDILEVVIPTVSFVRLSRFNFSMLLKERIVIKRSHSAEKIDPWPAFAFGKGRVSGLYDHILLEFGILAERKVLKTLYKVL